MTWGKTKKVELVGMWLELGRGLPCHFSKIGQKCHDFGKKCPDCGHLWIKFFN